MCLKFLHITHEMKKKRKRLKNKYSYMDVKFQTFVYFFIFGLPFIMSGEPSWRMLCFVAAVWVILPTPDRFICPTFYEGDKPLVIEIANWTMLCLLHSYSKPALGGGCIGDNARPACKCRSCQSVCHISIFYSTRHNPASSPQDNMGHSALVVSEQFWLFLGSFENLYQY